MTQSSDILRGSRAGEVGRTGHEWEPSKGNKVVLSSLTVYSIDSSISTKVTRRGCVPGKLQSLSLTSWMEAVLPKLCQRLAAQILAHLGPASLIENIWCSMVVEVS